MRIERGSGFPRVSETGSGWKVKCRDGVEVGACACFRDSLALGVDRFKQGVSRSFKSQSDLAKHTCVK